MVTVKSKRRVNVSNIPIRFKPFKEDMTFIDNIAKSMGKDRPEVVRFLVSEALKARRLKAVGKDETLDGIVDVQKKAVAAALTPLLEKLDSVSKQMDRMDGRVADSFDQTGRQLNFVVLCARFIVSELVICRLLLRDYVHTVYLKLVESVNKSTKDVEANFNTRMAAYKREAETRLDGLTEVGLEPLHTLADAKEGFRVE